jgi:hypothetical protein
MTANHDLERRLADYYDTEAPPAAPDWVLRDALATIDVTPQRRVLVRAPWREFPTMNTYARLAAAAVAVIAIAAAGVAVLRLGNSTVPGGQALTSSPEPSPSATSRPTPSPTSAPPLTESFTSTMHGISVSYPEGWTARAATEPWTDRPGDYQFIHPGFDVLHDPVLEDHLFLYITSRPIGDSTPEEWVAALMADNGCTAPKPIAVDGAAGLIGGGSCYVAGITTAGRGYEIALSASDDDPDAVAPYDRAWFEEVLATVQLHPEDAVE